MLAVNLFLFDFDTISADFISGCSLTGDAAHPAIKRAMNATMVTPMVFFRRRD
jgi:hypothetical protein